MYKDNNDFCYYLIELLIDEIWTQRACYTGSDEDISELSLESLINYNTVIV